MDFGRRPQSTLGARLRRGARIYSTFKKCIAVNDCKSVAVTAFKQQPWVHFRDEKKGKMVSFSREDFLDLDKCMNEIWKSVHKCQRLCTRRRNRKNTLYELLAVALAATQRTTMDFKRFQITKDFRVSVKSSPEKKVIYFWTTRKGSCVKLTEKEFRALLKKIHKINQYLAESCIQ